MNKLAPEKQHAIISALVEGNSLRATSRMIGVHRNTITNLMVRVAEGCKALSNWKMRELPSTSLQLDELWCFVAKKQAQCGIHEDTSRIGDFYTWVALDTETKIVPTHLVGKRNGEHAQRFVKDLAWRLKNRVQINTDGLRAYVDAIQQSFGVEGVDYAIVVKEFESEEIAEHRYSPPKVKKVIKSIGFGAPNMEKATTSHVERQNLTIRMGMRRFTRLTNGFSKDPDFLRSAVDLHFGHYNFIRKHQTLKTTPAYAAGVVDREWTIPELVEFSEAARA